MFLNTWSPIGGIVSRGYGILKKRNFDGRSTSQGWGGEVGFGSL